MVDLELCLDDFLRLTPAEVAYLHAQKLDRQKYDNVMIRNVIINAMANVNRGKNSKFIKLYADEDGKGGFTKKKPKREREDILKEIEETKAMVKSLCG